MARVGALGAAGFGLAAGVGAQASLMRISSLG